MQAAWVQTWIEDAIKRKIMLSMCDLDAQLLAVRIELHHALRVLRCLHLVHRAEAAAYRDSRAGVGRHRAQTSDGHKFERRFCAVGSAIANIRIAERPVDIQTFLEQVLAFIK